MASRWQIELEKVRAAHRGRLAPKHVVEAARDPDNPLHSKFEWDDGIAAEKFRLEQARQLIQLVTVTPEGQSEPVRMYVSLSSDRNTKGGYRAMIDVMSDEQLLAQLVNDARAELALFEQRYDRLRKLKPWKKVFAATKSVRAKK